MKLKRFFASFLSLTMFTLPLFAVGGNGNSKSGSLVSTMPQYQIFDIGVVTGDSFSQAFGISTGGIAVGRTIGSTAKAYTWTQAGGLLGLPNLSGRNFCVSNGANDNQTIVGTCSNTLSGTGKLPTVWQNGTAQQLPLPAGQTLGDANDVNSAGVAVGSAGAGTQQRGVIYNNGTGNFITQTTSNGSFFTTVFGVNDSGRVIGSGIDPSNAARTVGMVYDIGSSSAFEVGALPGFNSAVPFGISNVGHIVGASMVNQGPGMPFIWTQDTGMVAIPLPTGTNGGTAYAVNSSGWAVGTAGSNFAIPFLYDGSATYRLQDLIPANSGWDLSMNTSASARGISDNNIIVGTGVFNGQTHAYAMVPVAANVSISGRVLTAGGKPVRNAVVLISGGNLPSPVIVYTGSFGSFNFSGLQTGAIYSITVTGGKYSFTESTRTITPQSDISDFNFMAEQE